MYGSHGYLTARLVLVLDQVTLGGQVHVLGTAGVYNQHIEVEHRILVQMFHTQLRKSQLALSSYSN